MKICTPARREEIEFFLSHCMRLVDEAIEEMKSLLPDQHGVDLAKFELKIKKISDQRNSLKFVLPNLSARIADIDVDVIESEFSQMQEHLQRIKDAVGKPSTRAGRKENIKHQS